MTPRMSAAEFRARRGAPPAPGDALDAARADLAATERLLVAAGPQDASFIVPGAPVGKGRPRATAVGGRPRLYTPAKTREYEARVAVAAREALGGATYDGPVGVLVSAVFARPQRLAKDARDTVAHTGRPDLDNVVKAVVDGLAAHWGDDAQVCELRASKVYGPRGCEPYVSVSIWRVG